MSLTVTVTSYWKASLSDHDAKLITSMGLSGSTIKGSPYRTHLKQPEKWSAICGKAPGDSGRQRSMIDRRGWYVFANIEGPGRPLCEACLRSLDADFNITVTQSKTVETLQGGEAC